MNSLPEISLGTAALIIFIICAGFMFLRGLLRTLINVACLLVSAWVGFRVWLEAPTIALQFINSTSPIVTTGIPVLAGVITFVILRKLIGFFRAPVTPTAEDAAPRSSFSLIFRLLFAIVPAALTCLTIATFLRHASSVAEIKNSFSHEGAHSSRDVITQRITSSLSSVIPSFLIDKLDPLATSPRLRLAKLIAASAENPREQVINPETGQPYPRAIIVDEPELQSLAREGRFSTLLRHPLLSEALKDPTIRQALDLE